MGKIGKNNGESVKTGFRIDIGKTNIMFNKLLLDMDVMARKINGKAFYL